MKNALTAPISGADRDGDRDRDRDGDALLDVEDRDHHCRKRQHARNRQVEIARCQREDEPKGQHDDDRIEAKHRGVGLPGEHRRRQKAEADDQQCPDAQEAEFFRDRLQIEAGCLGLAAELVSIALSLASSEAMRASYAWWASRSAPLTGPRNMQMRVQIRAMRVIEW